MAAKKLKLYVVKTTVEYRDKKGDKLRLLRGPDPQEVPSELVKELEANGTIVAVPGEVTAKAEKAQAVKNADADSADDADPDQNADQDAGGDTDIGADDGAA